MIRSIVACTIVLACFVAFVAPHAWPKVCHTERVDLSSYRTFAAYGAGGAGLWHEREVCT